MKRNELGDLIINRIKDNPTEARLIKELLHVVIHELKVMPLVKNVWTESLCSCGWTTFEDNSISLGRHLYGKEYLNTFSHECRHLWQYKNDKCISKEYVNPRQNYDAYYNQECEVDAREYARKILRLYDYIDLYFTLNSTDFEYENFTKFIDTKWATAIYTKADTGEVISREQAKQSFAVIYTSKRTFTCHIYK